MKTTIAILEQLKAIAPSVAFSVGREIDPNFTWDGDGPEPEGFDACDVTVAAKAIVNGTEIKGCDYLGGSYFKPGEPCSDVHGYLPQMLLQAADDLLNLLPAIGAPLPLQAQLANAIGLLKQEMRARYDEQMTASKGPR